MTKKKVDTVIVGGGVAGLACARKLSEKGKEFILISEDIGGRILLSKDGKTNLGAFFVCSDYYNFLKFVKLKQRIKLSDFCFHENDKNFVLFSPTLLKYSTQMFKIFRMLYRFRKSFIRLRRRCEIISQKNAIEKDSYLYELYMQKASDFVKNINIEKGTKKYLSKGLYSTTFSDTTEMNAFSFLEFCLPLITPIYRFSFEKEKMIQPFKDNILLGRVNNIIFKNGLYKIKIKNEYIQSKNIVLATEIIWSKRFANIDKINLPVRTNMYYIKGRPNDLISRKKYHLFNPTGNIQAIANLKNGYFLFYYKTDKPRLDLFFDKFQIIQSKSWNCVGTINGNYLIETSRGNNMYLIGDFNIAGLEDAYITGIYAANKIISSI
jgi:hypothetical protein